MPANTSRSWSFRILSWVNFGLILSLGLSYLAEYVDPSHFWPLSFFGLAYPILLILNLISIIYFLSKRHIYFLLNIIIILIGYKELSRTFSFRVFENRNPLHPSGTFRLMTYNAHSFKSLDYINVPETKKEMLDIIRTEQPDILGIQEFFTKKKGEFDILDSIKEILHNPNVYYHKVQSGATESTGMALFSKYPIRNIELIGFDKSLTINGIIQADIVLPDTTFRLYCVHLQSIYFKPDDYAYLNRVKEKIKPELRPSKRIFEKLKSAFIKRAEQANLIHASIEKSPYPVIVMGDFNDTPVSYTFKTIQKKLVSGFSRKGKGFGKTYNGSFPNFQIDHILSDTLFHFQDYQIIEKKLSDHYPVRADLRLNRKN